MPRHTTRMVYGFTLIELLVVIAIIAVLSSLLLPTLSKARSRAKQVQCSTQQKQFGLGAAMYTDDMQWVPVDDIWVGSGTASWSGLTRRHNFWFAMQDYIDSPDGASLKSAPGGRNMWACPAIEYPTGTTTLAVVRAHGFSIGNGTIANYWTSVFFGFGLWKDDNSVWNKYHPRREAHGDPSAVIYMAEQKGVVYNRLGYVTSGTANVIFVHNRQTNFLFADGHVAAYPWNGRTTGGYRVNLNDFGIGFE